MARLLTPKRFLVAILLGVAFLLATAFPTFAITASVASGGQTYDTATSVYDGALHSVHVHTSEAAPVASHDVSGGPQGTVATAAAPLAAVLRLSVAANTAEHAVPIGPASEDAWTVLNRVDAKGSPLPGYKGGSTFENSQGLLPETPGVTYREWDVNPNIQGVPRDAERIVTGSDGSAYWTTDHYDSFTMFRGPTG